MTNTSRRTSIRLPIKMKVKISTDNYCTRQVITEDFSDGGIFVADVELSKLNAGSPVTVQADEGMESAPIINARIAWTNSVGAGIEYLLNDE